VASLYPTRSFRGGVVAAESVCRWRIYAERRNGDHPRANKASPARPHSSPTPTLDQNKTTPQANRHPHTGRPAVGHLPRTPQHPPSGHCTLPPPPQTTPHLRRAGASAPLHHPKIKVKIKVKSKVKTAGGKPRNPRPQKITARSRFPPCTPLPASPRPNARGPRRAQARRRGARARPGGRPTLTREPAPGTPMVAHLTGSRGNSPADAPYRYAALSNGRAPDMAMAPGPSPGHRAPHLSGAILNRTTAPVSAMDW
jgi:hypothetical protein